MYLCRLDSLVEHRFNTIKRDYIFDRIDHQTNDIVFGKVIANSKELAILFLIPYSVWQVCSSAFIQPTWLDGYFTIKFPNASRVPNLIDIDFRVEGKRAFTSFANYCTLAVAVVYSAQDIFLKNEFVTTQALARKYTDEKFSFTLHVDSFHRTIVVMNRESRWLIHTRLYWAKYLQEEKFEIDFLPQCWHFSQLQLDLSELKLFDVSINPLLSSP